MHVGHKLFISDSGEQALLVVNRAQIYFWELSEESGMPQWWRIAPPEGVLLPQNCNKEASIDACFHVHPVSASNFASKPLETLVGSFPGLIPSPHSQSSFPVLICSLLAVYCNDMFDMGMKTASYYLIPRPHERVEVTSSSMLFGFKANSFSTISQKSTLQRCSSFSLLRLLPSFSVT